MSETKWGSSSVIGGRLQVFEDNSWHVLDLEDETILRLVSRAINEWATFKEVQPHEVKRWNALMEQKITLESTLRDVLFEVNNKHVHEIHNAKRPDVNTFCIQIRDMLAETLAEIAASTDRG